MRPVAWRPLLVMIACGVCGYIFEVAAASGHPASARAYVSNEDGESVSVLDTRSATNIATIDVGKRPRGLKLSRDGARLFVAVSGLPKCPPAVPDEECAKLERDLQADGIAIVDTASHKVSKVLAAGSDPEQFALSNDDKRLYVANEDTGTLSVVDVEAGKVIERIKVGQEPEGVALTPNGRWLLVSNESGNSVSVIDTTTLQVTRTVAVGKRPRDMAFSPDGSVAYVSGEMDASLNRMSVTQDVPAQRLVQLRDEARPMGVILDSARHRLYLSTGRGGTVAVFDMKDGAKLIKEVPVGKRPWGMALSADGLHLYTANGPSNDVSVVDTTTLTEVKRVAVGKSPWGIVLGPVPP